jgi:hypothetical protein
MWLNVAFARTAPSVWNVRLPRMIPILWEALGHCRSPIASPQHPRSVLNIGPLLLPSSQRVIFFSKFLILRHGARSRKAFSVKWQVSRNRV